MWKFSGFYPMDQVYSSVSVLRIDMAEFSGLKSTGAGKKASNGFGEIT